MAASRDTTARDSSRREFSDKQPSGQRSQDRRRRRGDDGPGGGATVAPLESRERPANVDAERAVLGSILLKPDVCDDIALLIRPEDFADETHQVLYRHLLELHDSGKRIDVTIVVDRLRTQGDLDRVGGAAAIAEILEAVPHAAHATHAGCDAAHAGRATAHV